MICVFYETMWIVLEINTENSGRGQVVYGVCFPILSPLHVSEMCGWRKDVVVGHIWDQFCNFSLPDVSRFYAPVTLLNWEKQKILSCTIGFTTILRKPQKIALFCVYWDHRIILTMYMRKRIQNYMNLPICVTLACYLKSLFFSFLSVKWW